jgi:hypothetical protein
MEIKKGLKKIKSDLGVKFSKLDPKLILNYLLDYCSDTVSNKLEFEKFKQIQSQIDIIGLKISNTENDQVIVDKIVSKRFSLEDAVWSINALNYALDKELFVAKINAPIKKKSKIKAANLKSKASSKKTLKTKKVVSSNKARTPAYKAKSTGNKALFYNASALISILLAIGGLVRQIQDPLSGPFPVIAYLVLIVFSFFLFIFAVSNSENAAAVVHSIGLLIYIYSLFLILGMGFIYSGLAIVSVIIMFLGIGLIISDDYLSSGAASTVLFGLLLFNLSLIEGGILTGIVPFITTGVAVAISLLASIAEYSDDFEVGGYGTLNGIFFLGALIQFVFLFF